MNIDFHYYATYLAAIIAGYTHEESSKIIFRHSTSSPDDLDKSISKDQKCNYRDYYHHFVHLHVDCA